MSLHYLNKTSSHNYVVKELVCQSGDPGSKLTPNEINGTYLGGVGLGALHLTHGY